MRSGFTELLAGNGAAPNLPGSPGSPVLKRAQTARPDARLPVFPGAPPDVAGRLGQLNLMLIGLGSVLWQFALFAARMGVGGLWLVDPARIKPTSVLTHPVLPSAVGRAKVEHAGEQLKQIHPAGRVHIFHGKVEQLDLFQMVNADLIVTAPDTLTCIDEVGQRGQRLGQPVIQGAVHGASLTATVRVFLTACSRCLFTERDERDLGAERRFSCTGEEETVGGPTVAPAALCSLAASHLLMSVLRVVFGLGDPLFDTVSDYHALAHRALTTPIEVRSDCPNDHRRWELRTLPDELSAVTPRALLAQAGLSDLALEQVSLAVEGQVFEQSGACPCGQSRRADRFRASAGRAGRCPACSFEELPGELLRPHLDRPFGALIDGQPPALGGIRLEGGGRTVLFGRPELITGVAT